MIYLRKIHLLYRGARCKQCPWHPVWIHRVVVYCRSEPIPGLPVQGAVQHEAVSVLHGGARVRPGRVRHVRRRPVWQQQSVVSQHLRAAGSQKGTYKIHVQRGLKEYIWNIWVQRVKRYVWNICADGSQKSTCELSACKGASQRYEWNICVQRHIRKVRVEHMCSTASKDWCAERSQKRYMLNLCAKEPQKRMFWNIFMQRGVKNVLVLRERRKVRKHGTTNSFLYV